MVDSEARSTIFRRYAGALAVSGMAVFIRWLLNPALDRQVPFSPTLLAVLATARFFGLGPSVLAMVICGAGSLLVTGERRPLTIAVYLLSASVAIWMITALQRAHSSAREHAQVASERLNELRQETAKRLIEARHSAQLRAIVESSEDAIISKDLGGVIQSWNHSAEKIFGFTAAEAIGKNMSIVIPTDRMDEEEAAMARLRNGEQVKPCETIRICQDGRQIPVALTVSPIHDASGRVVGASSILRNISEQKALEEQLLQKQKMESLGVLAGGVAHDFNNLLTAIMGNASLILDEAPANRYTRKRASDILTASERAAVLVRQMLAYAGKARTSLERLNLSTVITELAPLVRSSLPRLVRLNFDLDPTLPPVEADRAQLQQLVMNLVTNAGESMEGSAGAVTIVTRLSPANAGEVLLECRDTGCGMDDATRLRIFDPFFTTRFTGRGLGLAAVMGIIRSHRGSIAVESAPGRGSCFTITLPAAEPSVVRGHGTVLVVDDEELVRNLARQALEQNGYRVETADDGQAAVDMVSAHHGDFVAILLDLTMPVMDGEEALRRIQEIEPGIAIVLTSGFSEAEAVDRFQDRGLRGFLQKPYTAATLTGKIKQAVHQRGVDSLQAG